MQNRNNSGCFHCIPKSVSREIGNQMCAHSKRISLDCQNRIYIFSQSMSSVNSVQGMIIRRLQSQFYIDSNVGALLKFCKDGLLTVIPLQALFFVMRQL